MIRFWGDETLTFYGVLRVWFAFLCQFPTQNLPLDEFGILLLRRGLHSLSAFLFENASYIFLLLIMLTGI